MFYIIGLLFALVAGVILAISALGQGATGAGIARVHQAEQEINTIRTGIQSIGFHNRGYLNLTNVVLEESGKMPIGMIAGAIGAGNDLDPWGGTALVGSFANDGVANSGYYVEFEGVPQAACEILGQTIGSGQGVTYGSVQLNGTWYGSGGGTTTTLACPSGGNTLLWAFID